MPVEQLREEIARLREENARLRAVRTPWNIDRDDVTPWLDMDGTRMHIVAALFDYAERAKTDSSLAFQGHVMALYAAGYIQWLEDELHRYQQQPVDNEIAVEGEEYVRWDEDEARTLAFKTEHESIHEILELAEHLGHALTVLDANRVWRVGAGEETTRLGQWNLKLREAVEAAQELLEDRYVEKQLSGSWDEMVEPVVKMLRSSLRAKPPSQPSVGLWPASIPPRHLCLWLREMAGGDAIVKIWANAIEQEYSETEAWKA